MPSPDRRARRRAPLALTLLALAIAPAAGGCAAAAGDDPSEVAGETAEGVNVSQAFFTPRLQAGFACGSNEVMLGVHYSKQYVICAAINGYYRIVDRPIAGNYQPQVSYSPTMHGCPAGSFLQAIVGSDATFRCVKFQIPRTDGTFADFAYSATYRDGPGSCDDGTQSDVYGITSPRMHVCAPGYAMTGLHVALNDLECGR